MSDLELNNLLENEWCSVCDALGKQKTIGLIKNGTSLEVAKQIANQFVDIMNLKLF